MHQAAAPRVCEGLRLIQQGGEHHTAYLTVRGSNAPQNLTSPQAAKSVRTQAIYTDMIIKMQSILLRKRYAISTPSSIELTHYLVNISRALSQANCQPIKFTVK